MLPKTLWHQTRSSCKQKENLKNNDTVFKKIMTFSYNGSSSPLSITMSFSISLPLDMSKMIGIRTRTTGTATYNEAEKMIIKQSNRDQGRHICLLQQMMDTVVMYFVVTMLCVKSIATMTTL